MAVISSEKKVSIIDIGSQQASTGQAQPLNRKRKSLVVACFSLIISFNNSLPSEHGNES
jgi:hypothetical protein